MDDIKLKILEILFMNDSLNDTNKIFLEITKITHSSLKKFRHNKLSIKNERNDFTSPCTSNIKRNKK